MEEDEASIDSLLTPWKAPINGKLAFFTEEVYRELMGPEPSLEEKIEKLMDDIEFAPVLPKKSAQLKKHEGDVNKSTPCSLWNPTCTKQKGGRKQLNRPINSWDTPADSTACSNPVINNPIKTNMPSAEKKLRPDLEFETRKSSLSHQEHTCYLELFSKWNQRFVSGCAQPPNEQELKELEQFEKLQVLVAKEQEEVQVCLKQIADVKFHLYNSLPPFIKKYSMENQQSGYKQAELYARYYKTLDHFPVHVDIPEQVPPSLIFLRTLLELGPRPHVILPELSPMKPTVPLEYEKINARFPSQPLNKSPDSWNHEPASRDSNMETLCHKYQCHIVTTASALSQILDNHPSEFGVAWDIPVVIKQYEGGASSKVVCLDKPLRPQGRTPSEKKAHYLQKALRTFISHPKQEKNILRRGRVDNSQKASKLCNSKPGESLISVDDDDPFGAGFSMDALETFGSDKMSNRLNTTNVSLNETSTIESARTRLEYSTAKDVSLKNVAPVDHNIVGSFDCKAGSGKQRNEKNSTDKNEMKEIDERKSSLSELQPCKQNSKPPKSAINSVHLFLTDDDNLYDSDENVLTIVESGFEEITPKNSHFKDVQSIKCLKGKNGGTQKEILSVEKTLETESDETIAQTIVPESECFRVTRSSSKRKSQEQAGEILTISISDKIDGLKQTSLDVMTEAEIKSEKISARVGERSTKELQNTQSGAVAGQITLETRRGRVGRPYKNAEQLNKIAKPGNTDEKGTIQQSKLEPAFGATPLDSILQLQKEMLPQKEGTVSTENAADYHQPDHIGVSIGYHLWNLGGFLLLVRCSNHGFIRDYRQQHHPVYITTKPERQIPHGLEQTTLSEMVRSWMGCYMRPKAHLIRARMDVQTNEIVYLEQLSVNQILQPMLNFSAPSAFTLLHRVFTRLTELPPGKYLLSHESGADHFQLRAATANKKGGYDLHFHCMGLNIAEDSNSPIVSWVPVDPTIILPYHWKNGRIPATFKPKDFETSGKKFHHITSKQKKKKKKKKNK